MIEDLTFLQRVATMLPIWLAAATVGYVAQQLWQVAGSLLALPIALALGGIAEIFRRGAALRDDVEGLV